MIARLVRRRKGVAAASGILALMTITSCEGRVRSAVAVGAPAPAYGAVTIAGDSASLEAERARGKVVLLNVWATWCHPCRAEIPVLQRLHERLASRGLEVIGVSVDARGEDAEVRDFARRFGMTYPIWMDPDERVSNTFLTIGVPATFLIARDGTLLWRHTGPIAEGDSTLGARLEAALGSLPPS